MFLRVRENPETILPDTLLPSETLRNRRDDEQEPDDERRDRDNIDETPHSGSGHLNRPHALAIE